MDEDVKAKNGKFQHLVTYCLELYEDFGKSEYRDATIKQITDSIVAYDQEEKTTDDPWPGASNITLPLTTISNDNLAPRLASGLIGKQPYIRFEMENDQDQAAGHGPQVRPATVNGCYEWRKKYSGESLQTGRNGA